MAMPISLRVSIRCAKRLLLLILPCFFAFTLCRDTLSSAATSLSIFFAADAFHAIIDAAIAAVFAAMKRALPLLFRFCRFDMEAPLAFARCFCLPAADGADATP